MTNPKHAASGQIWRAKTEVISDPIQIRGRHKRAVVVAAGELVEFRYWHPAHFRTVEDLYLSVDAKVFYEMFEYVGDVFEEVKMRNSNTMAEIIQCRLYTNAEVKND